MKILAIVGSPRKANTYSVLENMRNIMRESEVEAELIFLRDLDIRICEGCNNYCSTKKECWIQDDMQMLYRKLKEADAIIIGTPTYFWNVSGLLKTFIDRTAPLYSARALKGKIGAAFAVTEADGQNHALSNISNFFILHGIREIGSVAVVRRKGKVKDEDIELSKVLARKISNTLVERLNV